MSDIVKLDEYKNKKSTKDRDIVKIIDKAIYLFTNHTKKLEYLKTHLDLISLEDRDMLIVQLDLLIFLLEREEE